MLKKILRYKFWITIIVALHYTIKSVGYFLDTPHQILIYSPKNMNFG